MAGQLLTGTLLDADHLLQRAVERRFSFRGEIFSGVMRIFVRFSFCMSYYLLILFPLSFLPPLRDISVLSWLRTAIRFTRSILHSKNLVLLLIVLLIMIGLEP